MLPGSTMRLKLSLWREFEHDRDDYTAAKTPFVSKYTELAKAEHTQGPAA